MLGQTDLTKDVECEGCAPAQNFPIRPQDIIVHESYDKEKTTTQGHDIALVRLPRLANTHMEDEKYKVMPICLNYMKNQAEKVFCQIQRFRKCSRRLAAS